MRPIAVVLLAIAVILGAGAPALASSGCDGASPWQNACTIQNTGTQVDVGGSATQPGRGGGSSGSGAGGSTSTGGSGTSGTPRTNAGGTPPTPSPVPEQCPDIGCRGNYTVVVIPTVTIDDLASFVPRAGTLTGEPAGFGITGMPTNLIGSASTHELTGPLLGWTVTVRFVPAAWLTDYGDGTSARTITGGATWAALRLPSFSPTATSHVYAARGTYTVSSAVQYSAQVNFGTGWRTVPGLVATPPATYSLEIRDVRTALVERTCLEAPTGPGC